MNNIIKVGADEYEKKEIIDDGDEGIHGRRYNNDLQVLDDNVEDTKSNIPSSAYDMHKSSERSPEVRHHYPPPSISNSPVVTGGLKAHLEKKKKNSFMSSSYSSSSPPSILREDFSPTTSSSNGEGGSFTDTNDEFSHSTPHHTISSSSLVVCGVDGTVYTLDAYTGQLRGMFASGSALVYTSSPPGEENNNNAQRDYKSKGDTINDDAVDEDGISIILLENEYLNDAIPSYVKRRKERVVPGLDGRLYTVELEEELIDDSETCSDEDAVGGSCSSSGNIMPRFGGGTNIAYKSYHLEELPINAMDVVDSPISTCQPGTDQDDKQCGIIVGSKKTTIYAIDPTTGKVQWTQDPQGKAGGMGYTKSRPKKGARGKTVLLQREDYAVRHLDTDGGEEVWKVELGRFSALDFDVADSSSRDDRDTSSDDTAEDMFENESPPVGVGGRRRGAAATAATVNTKDKKKSTVPPILSGRKRTSMHDFESDFKEDIGSDVPPNENLFGHHEDEFDHSSFRGFPSIAFGEDGTCIMAVDGISGELLWKRRIDSVVAAAYGVGKESSWIPIQDETDSFANVKCSSTFNGQKVGLLPSTSSSDASSGGLVPYGVGGQAESGQLHRLGRHHSNLFVSSKLEIGYDAHAITDSSNEDDLLPYADSYDTPLPPRVAFPPTVDNIFTINSPSMSDIKPPQSHRTEHGLYLSWSMVASVALIVLSIVVFVARIIILRQRRKYENTPSLDPTAPNSSEDGKEQSQSSGGITLPPSVHKLSEPLSLNSQNIWSNKKLPPTRSYSLGAMGSHSFSPLRSSKAAQTFISDKHGATLTLPETSTTSPLSPNPSAALASTTTQGSPTIGRSMTLPTEPSPSSDDKVRSNSIDNIDGIPLVRYSRYTSEFKEISPLGRGGFGTVFQCRNNLDEREYAIKKIKIISQISNDGTVTKRYSQKLHRVLREVKSLALLDHPNIVRYYTAWLEVDQNEDEDETIATGSIFDRKSQGLFSNSLFSGWSKSRGISQTQTISPRRSKGPAYNPLGWANNFGSSFRLDESKSEASLSFGGKKAPLQENEGDKEDDDLGFTWERSNDNIAEASTPVQVAKQQQPSDLQNDILKEEDSESSSGISSIDSKESENTTQPKHDTNQKTVKLPAATDTDCEKTTTEGRHILFIQMQLCSEQTLADFLSNREERRGSLRKSSTLNADYAVDIPFALRLFSQIAHGVKYVHKQGLIHRDLKPQNCFIDELGNAKVGDFGLSRESSTAGVINELDEEDDDELDGKDDHDQLANCSDADNTAGVGTRAYASPEQMRDTNYDASTDVYSLGLMLFELCYPMYTSMERYTEFGNIRKGRFPAYWMSDVKSLFPTMHDILIQMLSDSPSQRPTASVVSDQVDSILREYSIQSLDKSWQKKGALLLRVEAQEKEGVLQDTMKIIKDAVPQCTILQYGLRGQASKAIMEFALDITDNEKSTAVKTITSQLEQHDMNIRRISS